MNTQLDTVTIKAFEQPRKWRNVAAAVGFINRQRLDAFGAASVVQAVNTLPGVRMEERSPGSYRINIRGSSLRSPFGVRNVKVYYNDIPFSDPGGNTYLNALGSYNIQSLEVIKGPGSSIYGAGTGGVLLAEGMDAREKPALLTEVSTGSFGLKNVYAAVTTGPEAARSRVGFQYEESDGYRRQSSLNRAILNWNGRFAASEKAVVKTTFLYSRLFYETPGALTKAEYDANPRLARPAGGGFPGAEAAKASVTQSTFWPGLAISNKYCRAFPTTHRCTVCSRPWTIRASAITAATANRMRAGALFFIS